MTSEKPKEIMKQKEQTEREAREILKMANQRFRETNKRDMALAFLILFGVSLLTVVGFIIFVRNLIGVETLTI